MLPRDKLAVLTWWAMHGDPRGTSILRRAFESWRRERQDDSEVVYADEICELTLEPARQTMVRGEVRGGICSLSVHRPSSAKALIANFRRCLNLWQAAEQRYAHD